MSLSINEKSQIYFNAIVDATVQEIVRVSAEHIAVPPILGFSADHIPGMPHLSLQAKTEVCRRAVVFLEPFIKDKIQKLVHQTLSSPLSTWSAKQLRDKAVELREKVKQNKPSPFAEPTIQALFADCTSLFKHLFQEIQLPELNAQEIHDQICPILCQYRDSGVLMRRINLETPH